MRHIPRHLPGYKIGARYLVHQGWLDDLTEVYRCLDTLHNQPLVLRTILPPLLARFPKLSSTFFIEAGRWIALRPHANVVRCYRMEILENQPFMLTDWVVGRSLREVLGERVLPQRQALDIAIDLCRALAHLNAAQPDAWHGNVKPENVLLTSTGSARLTGFTFVDAARQAGVDGFGGKGRVPSGSPHR